MAKQSWGLTYYDIEQGRWYYALLVGYERNLISRD